MWWNVMQTLTGSSDVDCVTELSSCALAPVHPIAEVHRIYVARRSSHWPPDGTAGQVTCRGNPTDCPRPWISRASQWQRLVRHKVLCLVRAHREGCCWLRIWGEKKKRSSSPLMFEERTFTWAKVWDIIFVLFSWVKRKKLNKKNQLTSRPDKLDITDISEC